MSTTTAYTADVTVFSYFPELYAQDAQQTVAELRIPIYKDWQHCIELWFQSDIGKRFKPLMLNASGTRLRFGTTARALDSSYVVSSSEILNYGFDTSDGAYTAPTAAQLDTIDSNICKTLVFVICSFAGLFSGHAYVHNEQALTHSTNTTGGGKMGRPL